MRRLPLLIGWFVIGALAGCATAPPAPAVVQHEEPAAPSATAELPTTAPSDLYITEPPAGIIRTPWWRWMQGRVLYPLQENLDVVHVVRALTGHPRPAMDLVEGYVADSSFFTNRAIAALTPDAVRRGPAQPSDAPQPPFVFEGLRSSGRAPGFFAADAKGDQYLFVLDFRDAPELVTGAEVVTSKLLHALGYDVLPAEIYPLNPADVQMDSPRYEDLPDREPATLEDVERLLAPRLNARGRVRTAALKLPDESMVVGSFSFKRYQQYAALRALRLADGWLHNVDAGELQTLMTWDGHLARGYLVDFGSSLGSSVRRAGPKEPQDGWGKAALWSLATLGWRDRPYDPDQPVISPAVGRLAARWDPERWTPETPNIAFDQMTGDDARWMARRISALSSVQLAAAVAAGQYQRPEDADALIAILRGRQAVIRRSYLGEEAPPAPMEPAAPAVSAPPPAAPVPTPVVPEPPAAAATAAAPTAAPVVAAPATAASDTTTSSSSP